MNLKQLCVRACEGVVAFIGQSLPSDTKRIVFLASLSARLKETSTFDNETLAKLNTLISLGKNTQIQTEMGVCISKAVWHGRGTKEILGVNLETAALPKTPAPGIVENIMSKMPAWLRYGSDEEIKRDVVKLLKDQDIVFGT
jgi:hypothetical protein